MRAVATLLDGIFGLTELHDDHTHDLESDPQYAQLVRRNADLSVLLDHPCFDLCLDREKGGQFDEFRFGEKKEPS